MIDLDSGVPRTDTRQEDAEGPEGAGISGAFPLSLARRGERVRIAAFLTGKGIGRRLSDLGLHKGSVVEVLHRERNGSNVVQHDGTRIALGAGVTQMISVTLDAAGRKEHRG